MAPVQADDASKGFASLSSGLLARKGQARPAMRRQEFVDMPASAEALDDLGWNDMGEPATAGQTSAEATPLPPVLVERAKIEAQVAAPIAGEPVATAPRTAFTLRLDADRRLRLRLASAVTRRSAQTLLTGALDTLLAGMPAIEALVAEMPDGATVQDRTRKIKAPKITSGGSPQ